MPAIPYASRSARPPVSPAWASGPWLVALAVAAIAIAGALLYARESSGVVCYRLVTDGSIVLTWVASAAGTGAFVLRLLVRGDVARVSGEAGDTPGEGARPADRRANKLLYFVTSAAAGLGMIGLAVLGLGLAGLLNRVTSVAILLPGLRLGWLALRARGRESVPLATATRLSHWHWLWLAAAPFLAVSLIGTMVPPGLIWNPEEPHGYDVVEYHLQVPREWYEAGRIVPLKHNVFSYFPMGVEAHYLLAMEIDGGPWEGMYLAQLMHLALIVLTVLAAWGVAMQFASSRASATVGAVALATIPWMAQLGAIAYNEGGFLLNGTLAVGWAMQGLSAPAGSRSRLRRFALAGAMAGFACGAKLTAVPELLLGVPAVCFAMLLFMGLLGAMGKRTRLPVEPVVEPGQHGQASTLAHGTPSGRSDDHPVLKSIKSGLIVSLVFGIAGLLTFAPWLARNVAWAGNPVFPEAASILGKAHLTDVQIERLKRANHEPGIAQRGAMGHVRAIWDQLLDDWQFGYLLLPLGVASIALLTRRRRHTSLSANLPPSVLRGRAGEGVWPAKPPRQNPLPNPPPEYRGREKQGPHSLESPNPRLPPSALLPALMLLFLTIFWIGFTHLQSRFFLLAGPLAVILIARVEWGCWLRLVATFVVLAAVIGWWGLNRRIASILYAPSPGMLKGLVEDLGHTSPHSMLSEPDGQITLVGDSWAFRFRVPMTRLRYRTIFDLDTTGLPAAPDTHALIAVWAGRPPGAKPPPVEWLVIDGPELERFSKTYFGVPPPPPEWRDRTAPFVLPP